MGAERRAKEIQLRDEPGRQGQAGERHHEQHQGGRGPGRTAGKAREILDPVRLHPLARQQQQDAERSEVHGDVDQEIEEHAPGPGGPARSDPDHEIAGVGDAGVGQEPLQVCLKQRGEVAQDHRDHGDRRQHRPPDAGEVGQREGKDPEQPGERPHLGHDRHERRDRERGALVDVRRPGMEGDERSFERQPDREERDPGAEEPGGPRRPDLAEIDRPGRPEYERDPVGKKGGGERAEEQVLQAGLQRPPASPRDGRQDVQGEAQDLEAEEKRDQRSAGRHHHRPHGRQQEQRVVLARREPHPGQVRGGEQDAESCRGQRREIGDHRELIADIHAAERRPPPPAADIPHQRQADRGKRPPHGRRPRRLRLEDPSGGPRIL